MERLEDAVVREVEEEVGLEIADLHLLCVIDYMVVADDAHWVCPTYLAQTVSGEPVNREPTKLGAVAWYPLSNLPHPLTLTTQAALHALWARNPQPIAVLAASRNIEAGGKPDPSSVSCGGPRARRGTPGDHSPLEGV